MGLNIFVGYSVFMDDQKNRNSDNKLYCMILYIFKIFHSKYYIVRLELEQI